MSTPSRRVLAATVLGALLVMIGGVVQLRPLKGQLRPDQEKAVRQVAARQSGFLQVGKFVLNRQRIDFMMTEDNGELSVFLGGSNRPVRLSAEEAKLLMTSIGPLQLGAN